MSKVCSLCGKGPSTGNNVSHSKRRTKRRFMPNLVTKRGIKICTSCLRTLTKPPRKKNIKKVKEQEISATPEKTSKQDPVENQKEGSSSEE